jgi:hypothetical protein
MYNRRLTGIFTAALSIVAIIVAAQGLVTGIKAALAEHSPSLAGGGVLAAVLMLYVAVRLAQLAYRNLFWTRYAASLRSQSKRRDHTDG